MKCVPAMIFEAYLVILNNFIQVIKTAWASSGEMWNNEIVWTSRRWGENEMNLVMSSRLEPLALFRPDQCTQWRNDRGEIFIVLALSISSYVSIHLLSSSPYDQLGECRYSRGCCFSKYVIIINMAMSAWNKITWLYFVPWNIAWALRQYGIDC